MSSEAPTASTRRLVAVLFSEDVTANVDLTRATVGARCPFCGGQYGAGYLVTTCDEYRAGGRLVIRHTMPHCAPFASAHGFEFLTRAREAGAVRTELTPARVADLRRGKLR